MLTMDIMTEKWTQERIDILRDYAKRWRAKAAALPDGEAKLEATKEADKADRLGDTIALWIANQEEEKKDRRRGAPARPKT